MGQRLLISERVYSRCTFPSVDPFSVVFIFPLSSPFLPRKTRKICLIAPVYLQYSPKNVKKALMCIVLVIPLL